ncbi:MAG: TonB family protein [Calditrichia bacterium]
MKAKLLYFSLLFGILSSVFAQEIIEFRGSVIDRDTRWNGTVRIYQDIIIKKGVTLSLEPKTRIIVRHRKDRGNAGLAKDKVEIIVHGRLIARGTPETGKIVFTSRSQNPQMNDWYGIILKNPRQKSIIEHCVVEYAFKGITCYGSSPEISNSEVRFNHYAGISAEVRAKPFIRDCIIIGNDFAGLNCELGSKPIVERTIITQNNNGVIVFDRSQPDLGRVASAPGESTGENRIYNNFEVDIYNNSSLEVSAQNNIWNNATTETVMQKIRDVADNNQFGAVLILPIFNEPALVARNRPRRVAPVIEPPVAQVEEETTTPSEIQTLPEEPRITGLPDLAQNTLDTNSLGQETLTVYKEEVVARKPDQQTAAVSLKEPIIEALLDGGSRTYVAKAKAFYPEIYKKTGFEGRVFLEVIVGRDGKIENHQVLKSDGIYFTYAAEEALKQMRYAPETFQGKPVRYKIIEPFIFKLASK